MKFTHTIIFSLFFLAVFTVAKQRLPTHEVLPTPVLVHSVKDNPNKYIVENIWYGNGYEDNDRVTAILRCKSPVVVNATHQPTVFGTRRMFFELTVPDNVDTVYCKRGIVDIESFRGWVITFDHAK